MSTKPLVYVAAPYTHPDPVENTHKVIKVADTLLASGQVTPIVPHLTMFWHAVSPKPYETWLAYDLQVMRRCDAVLRLPGKSSGADDEVADAQRFNIPIFLSAATLLAWADGFKVTRRFI